MKNSAPQTIQLKDYLVPDFIVSTVDLDFDLFEEEVIVSSKIQMERNPKSVAQNAALVLDGDKLELRSVKINGKELSKSEYVQMDHALTIAQVPATFTLECVTKIEPQKNLTLEGLYKSTGMFCTQCEAQGFRKITYFLDRPDVMAIYSTTIRAEKAKYPILLSNGNKVAAKDLGDGRHMAQWKDPFKKPCYLYALVAGDLGKVEDHFITSSGKNVLLQIFVNKGNEDRCAHAMDSLKRSMKWDEEVFGLEYDLDIFMIVAVDDFNFGAMENKGLNIFNSHYILAKASTATDTDYQGIEGVVAHEYFHNWTGNRVTCRDWFQLSLKEGLTVYRDQEFSSDMTSRSVVRIDNVNHLRNFQFAEDAGPMAHPIRPASYIEINNFYTMTVYEKGAEVIRMIATLIGKEKFRRGIDKYFELYDGQAVTTEDFVHAMEVASGKDLSQFRNTWYVQAGTPVLKVRGEYDAGAKSFALHVEQSCAPTPGQEVKKPFHIPFQVGLIDSVTGKEVASQLLEIKEPNEKFSFAGIASKPIPSLLRNFSAPVRVEYDYSEQELVYLLAHDKDNFARWEAGQKLAVLTMQKLIDAHKTGQKLSMSSQVPEAFAKVLGDSSLDHAFIAQLLELPEESYMAQLQKTAVDPDAIHAAREYMILEIARFCEKQMLSLYQKLNTSTAYKYEAKEVGRRSLKNTLLQMLTSLEKQEYLDLALTQMRNSNNLTDEIAALSALNDTKAPARSIASKEFYQKWEKENLVINKWLSVEASSTLPGALERVKEISKLPVFNINNPNKVSALFSRFCMLNPTHFHAKTGEAYRFLADQIIDIDTRNPSLSSRLAGQFNQWKRFDDTRKSLMKKELERIVATPKLSTGVFEIVSKALQ